MFAKVMYDNPDICQQLANLVLGFELGTKKRIEVEATSPETDYRGVRFDVCLEDPNNLVAVEMQAISSPFLANRKDYYHIQLGRHTLEKGLDYDGMRSSYVVFICMFDPFEEGLVRYVSRDWVEGPDGVPIAHDGNCRKTIYWNALADLEACEPNMRRVLNYLLYEQVDQQDVFVAALDSAVHTVLEEKDWVGKNMWLECEFADRRREGREEGRAEGLAEGREEAQFQAVSNLMSTMLLTAEEAMDALKIPAKEREYYLKSLEG